MNWNIEGAGGGKGESGVPPLRLGIISLKYLYKMKFRAEYVVPIVILVVALIVSLCQSCVYFMPYDSEGYENLYSQIGAPFQADGNSPTAGKNFQAASAPVSGGAVTMGGQYETTMGGQYETTMGGSNEEGFQNLEQASAIYGNEVPIDVYSHASGNLTCAPGPYSNSMGYLCLDKNQQQLLSTRGMNQSTGASQIGQGTM